jgi:hypothetical protein
MIIINSKRRNNNKSTREIKFLLSDEQLDYIGNKIFLLKLTHEITISEQILI